MHLTIGMRNLHSSLGISLLIALLTLLMEGLAIGLFLVIYQGDPKALPRVLIKPFGTLIGVGIGANLIGRCSMQATGARRT